MSKKATYFRLFNVIAGGKQSGNKCVESEGNLVQAALFPTQQQRSVIFVSMPGVSDDEFVSLLQTTKPAYVVELRPVPRFDIGHLNRQAVFAYFRRQRCTYLDPGDFAYDEERLRSWLQPTAAMLKSCDRGPVMFLVSGAQDDRTPLRRVIYEALDCADGEWQVYELSPPQCEKKISCPASSHP